MFDRIVDFLLSIIGLFKFWAVVDQWERGIVVRLGRYNRMARPGFMWIWPFSVEHVLVEDTYKKVTHLHPQSLTTADGKSVVASAVVTYRVRNAKKVILTAGGHEEAIVASVPGTIGKFVMAANYTDLNTEEFRSTVTTACNEEASAWGMEIEEVRFANLVAARSYRLFAEKGGPNEQV